MIASISDRPGEIALTDRSRLLLVRFPPWMELARTHPRDLIWPIPALFAAARARAQGCRARLLDLHVESLSRPDVVRRLLAEAPDLAVLDLTTASLAAALDVAGQVRRGRPRGGILAAGQHASSAPGDLLFPGSPFSGLLRGEPDAALAPLLARGTARGTAGCSWLSPSGALDSMGPPAEAQDLDALPPLSPQGLPLDRYTMRSLHIPSFRRPRWGFLQTSRGCPYRCVFCSPTLRQSFGRTYRVQSAARVHDDLARLRREHGIDAVYFIDDLFSYDRPRTLELCRLLSRRPTGVSWVCQTRVDCLDEELLRAMRAAGCRGLKLGIESGSDRVLGLLRKGITREQTLRVCRQVRRAGLLLTACYILGSPTETPEEMEETFALASQVQAEMIQVTFHTPYPGSESFRRANGEITEPSRLAHYETPPDGPGQAFLERAQRRFYLRYYLSPAGLMRYLRHRAIHRLADPDEWRLMAQALRFWTR